MHYTSFGVGSEHSGFPMRVNLDVSAAQENPDLNRCEPIIQLFRETRIPLYSYLICIGLVPSEADDVVQETFLRLHSQFQSGATIEEPRAWIFRVARNRQTPT
jgi:RNA polymerase sigma-70 factor (ECF subfamily)